MSLEKLVLKYMRSAERALSELEVVVGSLTISVDDVRRVVDSAKAYLYDAEYYRDRKRFEVSLASVAYCEGLLDALKMLGAVEFEWVREKRNEK